MATIHTCVCSKRTTGNNAEYASGPLPFLNGKEIKEFISVLVYAVHAVRIKTFVKCVLLI